MSLQDRDKMNDAPDYKAGYHRQKLAREKAESLLEVRSRELYEANQTVVKAYNELRDQKEQLMQQEKMASIGLLAAGVAHEINNPVGFVKSNLKTLQNYFSSIKPALDTYHSLLIELDKSEHRAELEAQTRAVHQFIEDHDIDFIITDSIHSIEESLDGTRRIENIVRNLNNYARSDEDERNEVDLNQCIDDTIKLLANELKYKCIIEKTYGDIPKVKACPGQLNQVFVNIFMNAVQAMDSDGSIEIRTTADTEYVYASFIDNGPGIAEKDLGKLFDPFFTTKDVGAGTGLGLYVSHTLLEKHHGSLTAKNEEGKGANITVSLPIGTPAQSRLEKLTSH